MPEINRWRKYLREAIGEDLRKEDEPLMHLSQVAKLRDVDIIDAITSLFLGPLMPLYVTSPSFKKEVDIATQILPNIEGYVINKRNIPILAKRIAENKRNLMNKYQSSIIRSAVAYVMAKYPRLFRIPSFIDAVRTSEGNVAEFYHDLNRIVIDPKIHFSLGIEDAVENLVHELIHAYEYKRNPKAFIKTLMEEYEPAYRELHNKLAMGAVPVDDYLKLYEQLPGESAAMKAGRTAKETYKKYMKYASQQR